MDKLIALYPYKCYIVFFFSWMDPYTADSVEVWAKDRQHAYRIFMDKHVGFYEPLAHDKIEIVESNDYLD